MNTQRMRTFKTSVAAAAAVLAPAWLWTWGGVCFGYRRGDSLFTYDGVEVGRFSGAEIYGADGHYIGELRATEDGGRLITNIYKKSRTMGAFSPTRDHAYRKPADLEQKLLYTGHEDFPAPKATKKSAAGGL